MRSKLEISANDRRKRDLWTNILAILQSIVQSDDRKVRTLKNRDLKDKLNQFKSSHSMEQDGKKKFDVVIFTIVPVEFIYANKILNFMQPDQQPDFSLSGLGYHEFEIPRKNKLRSLKAAITLVGTAGDVNCSLACSSFFSNHHCDLAILCGIAAGLKEEMPIYSTVIARQIVNYEFQRIETKGPVYRPKIFNLDAVISNSLTNLAKYKDSITEEIKANIKALKAAEKPFDKKLLKKIKTDAGVVASGAKLLADGKTLSTLRKNIPIEKGIVAAEMEGSGFAPACELYRKNWMVFRGISDYGEEDKDNVINKEFQKVAVISAVTTMLYFLTNFYETLRESGNPKVRELEL